MYHVIFWTWIISRFNRAWLYKDLKVLNCQQIPSSYTHGDPQDPGPHPHGDLPVPETLNYVESSSKWAEMYWTYYCIAGGFRYLEAASSSRGLFISFWCVFCIVGVVVVRWELKIKTKCIPVGCVPTASWPYPSMRWVERVCIPACTGWGVYPCIHWAGGTSSHGGGVCP